MLDAISVFDPENIKTYSIYEFKLLADVEIDKLRYSLLCPACQQKAYFRRASKDGKQQACFGSRYHHADCIELNSSSRKTEEDKLVAEVEQIVLEEDSLIIDFKQKLTSRQNDTKEQVLDKSNQVEKTKRKSAPERAAPLDKEKSTVCKQGLAKLLTSLLRGSSLAAADLWIYTSDKHKWRAKNLFVNIADAQPTDNGAPRMYWGTVSHADKDINWLNPAEDRSVGIPISKYREPLLDRFDIHCARDVEGAGFILFGKCVQSRDKKRKYIHLWGNDPQYIYLSKAGEA